MIMRRIFLNDVRIGVLDDNSKFVLAPFMRNKKIYLQGESSDAKYQKQIKDYKIYEQGTKLLVYFTDVDGIEYKAMSFAQEYIQYLNKFNCSIVELIVQCKTINKKSMCPCKIYDFKIVLKECGKEILIPPIKGLKQRAAGNISGHKYLKNVFGRTSKIIDLNACARLLTSTRTEYELYSISKEYEDYLMDVLSDVETVLEYYPT